MASDLPWKEHVQAIKASHAPRVAQTHEVPLELKKKEKARPSAEQLQSKDRAVHERQSVLPPELPGRRKKKKDDVNVFQDFGKEHDDAPIQEVKKNGMVFYKVNYDRSWQSERDLQRWSEALQHNIRYERLLYKVRDRWHEDLLGDRLQLKISHNPLVRSRSQRYRPSSQSSSVQLKDLQKQLAPKDANKKKKVMSELASKTPGNLFGAFFGGDDGILKDDAMLKDEGKDEGQEEEVKEVPLEEDVSASRSELGEERQSNASSRRKSTHVEALEDGRSEAPKSRPREVTTMALLLFRNADRLHSGETLFVKRWPPAGGLKELLQLAGEACKPVVAPARALYDVYLQPILSLEEVRRGATYLVKGLEAFDPPKLFFNHDPLEVPSLRNLIKAKAAVAGERDVLEQFSQVPSHASQELRASVDKEPLPTADSPPWLSKYGRLVFPTKAREWQLDDHLQHALNWSCQGPSHRHYVWDEWSPVLQTRIRHKRIDCYASTTF